MKVTPDTLSTDDGEPMRWPRRILVPQSGPPLRTRAEQAEQLATVEVFTRQADGRLRQRRMEDSNG